MSTVTEPGRMNAEQTGRRVEELLDRLAATGDGAAHAAAEDLVRALMDFYGAGLARTLALLTEQAGPGSPVLGRLLEDELVAGLLVLHDLHPWDVTARIDRALATVQAHPAEVLAFEPDTGVLRLRLTADAGGGCGCGSSDGGAQQAVEGALACFAPEVTTVELEQSEPRAAEPVLLQIGPRPVEAG